MMRLLVVAVLVAAASQQPYDIVIKGGRVIDPETGHDAQADVAVAGGSIARISKEPLSGARVIDATGLVVAPGFVDLHSHGQDRENDRLKVLDGVTTALELEIGHPDVGAFLAERAGKALVNFGATVSHAGVRAAVFGSPLSRGTLLPPAGAATNEPATAEQVVRIARLIREGIATGALGVGMGLAYTPGATRLEVIEMFRVAADARLPVFVHVRSAGRVEPGSSVESIAEVIAAAAISGASLHIVHINSSGLRDAIECLRLVEGARSRGLDVTTEGYPYGAGQTAVNSALFNPGWRERLGIDYKDLQLVETGERLTEASFNRLHALTEPKYVLLFLNPDDIVDAVITHPLVMIASDGAIRQGTGHPRAAGTYARVLSRYVREQRTLTLIDALRKMTLMPAQRLERATPAARRKGRLQERADADIVVFDPRTIADRATYESPAVPSVGVRHVLVGGVAVVRDGQVVAGVAPGQPLRSDR